MTADSNRLDRMDANARRELLARLLRERAAGSGEEFELSPGQEALWFLHELAPDSAAYNVAFCARLRSEVDRERLECALLKLMERHPMLRCTVVRSAQGARQRIGPVPERCLEIVDASGWDDEELKARVEETHSRPFDLAAGPAFRCTLFSRCPTEHVLLLGVHHLFSDAWSFGILVSDLTTLYENGPTALAPLSTTAYADYVKWQRAAMDSAEGRQAWEYWQARLKDLPSTGLPADHPRPKMQSFRGASHHFELPAELCDRLRALARAQDATPFMVVAAAFHVLLARYCGSPLVPIGTPLSGRSRREEEGTVGYFINPVVLCAPVQPGTTFRQHIADMRAAAIGAQRFGGFPFPELVKRIHPLRDTGEMPIFQVMLNLIKASQVAVYKELADADARIRVGSLVLQAFPLNQLQGQFDLNLDLFDPGGAMPAVFKYRTDLFEPTTVERLAGHFLTLLSAGVADPDRPISDLPLLTEAERNRIVVEWNATTKPYPETTLHRLIEEQVRRTPAATALVFDGKTMSYDELNRRANQLARRLRQLGVRPDTLVGVCLERSFEMVVALLGILKAGGAYVPIDPEYPPERVQFMLRDAGFSVLLTQARLASLLAGHNGTVICVDSEWEQVAGEDTNHTVREVAPDNLAYMIYTSGSTGKPKGAMNTHRGICNRLLWMQDRYGLQAADKVLQKTPFSFDVSVWEFFWPLLVGARLVIAKPGGHRDPSYLVRSITEEQITVAHFVPSMLGIFLAEAEVERCRSLRHVICSGEALSFHLQQRFFALLPAELHNLYGPTEAAVDVTHWTCERTSERNIVPIGRPVANTQVYILDPQLQPVPIGVPGELHIGGIQVGRGYHNRPELTAEKFIADPFDRRPERRLYKTGDLCRWLADGSIDYLGRVDFQVKIRGLRIELGEIETVLGSHDAVNACVVVARENEPGDKSLVAYVEPRAGSVLAFSDLRTHLKKELPEYMIPSVFVKMERLPLNPNGKVDRKALPPPSPDDVQSGNGSDNYRMPDNHVELLIVEIWREVLGVQQVGLLDNFFELGGHSLSATRLIARLRAELQVDLPLRSIFIYPTIADLSRHLSYDVTARAYRYTSEVPQWNCLVPAQPGGTRIPLFFVVGLYKDDTLLVLSSLISHLGLDQPVFGLRPRWIEDPGYRYNSIEELAREFVTELRNVQPHGPYFLGGACVSGVAALEVARLLVQDGEEVKVLVLIDTGRPSARRKVLTDLFFLRQRLSHMADVLSRIVHSDNQKRREIIGGLLRARSGVGLSQQAREESRLYEAKVSYRKLLNSHTPKQYEGRIALIVNEDQARFDKHFGWEGIAPRLEVYPIPGDHDTILAVHGKEVAQVILRCIDEALGQPRAKQREPELQAP